MVVEKPETLDKELQSEKRSRLLKKIVINTILIIGAAFMLTPLLWMVATALSPNTVVPSTSLIPHNLTFENFVAAWNFPKAFSPDPTHPITMGTFFKNSLICTAAITTLGILVDSLAAYVLAFKDFPGKRLFIFLALATMMIPFYVTLVPEYLIIRKLGWINTYKAMIIPFLASGMGISLFRSHFLGLSRELEESAKIDGASDFRVYLTIIMPISRPVIGTMAILKAMWSWNQYMWPLIVSTDISMKPIQVALNMFRGLNLTEWGYLCAGMTMAILPLVIVFLCAQKQFIGGLQAGAVKG